MPGPFFVSISFFGQLFIERHEFICPGNPTMSQAEPAG